MTGDVPTPESLKVEYADDLLRITDDIQNDYSISKISFIYSRLKSLGPWGPDNLTTEAMLEIDTLQSAFAVEYARMFSTGTKRVSADKIPKNLKSAHNDIIALRNKRYAHNDNHTSVENFLDLRIDGQQVVVSQSTEMNMFLGAPPIWKELIDWVHKYSVEQSTKQLNRLTKKSGLEWVQQTPST
jgi:hypothetical protein